MRLVEANALVTVRCAMRTRAGVVVHDGAAPFEYVHGYGTLLPGLEAALAGMRVGERRTVDLPAEEAFGERDEELVFTVGRGELPEDARVGDELSIESPEGAAFDVRVAALGAREATLDANSPHAGEGVVCDIEVVGAREATLAEIRAATGDFAQIGRKPAKGHG